MIGRLCPGCDQLRLGVTKLWLGWIRFETGKRCKWLINKLRKSASSAVPRRDRGLGVVERFAVKRTLNGALDPLLPVVLLRSGPWWISLNGPKPTKLLAAAAMSATRPALAR